MVSRNYTRASDGKFSSTPGGPAQKKSATTAHKAKGTKKSLSAKGKIAADEKSIGKNKTGSGSRSGTITAKGFKKKYSVNVKKNKDGSSTRTVQRRSVRTDKDGKKHVIFVKRVTQTDKNGNQTTTRAVNRTGRKNKTTVTKRPGRSVAHKTVSKRKTSPVKTARHRSTAKKTGSTTTKR